MSANNFFNRYIQLVATEEVSNVLQHSLEVLIHLDLEQLVAVGDKVYAPDKWHIRDILQHLIDTERIMSYRALCFARNDATLQPSFDEDYYTVTAHATRRSLQDILLELKHLRQSSIHLFGSFDASMMKQTGVCYGQVLSVEALAYVIAGHQFHHLTVMSERYYPLA